jgi:hypothetical protein
VFAGREEFGMQHRHGRLDGESRDYRLVERLLGEAARDEADAGLDRRVR